FRDPDVWQNRRALQALADGGLRGGGGKLDELSPPLLESLAWLLGAGGGTGGLLRGAQRRHPGGLLLGLAPRNLLHMAKQNGEAVGYSRVAVALRPDAAVAHNNLGDALRDMGNLDEALAELHTAIVLAPKDAAAHHNLGMALYQKKDVEGAIDE